MHGHGFRDRQICGPPDVDSASTWVVIAVKVGDKILIAKYSGSDVKAVGKDHIIVREDDVLGILEGDRQ